MATAQDHLLALAILGTATIVSEITGQRPLKLSLAGRWLLTIKCTHATRGLSVVRYRRRGTTDSPWGPWVTAAGITVAPDGGTADVGVDGDCAEDLDVELTGNGGTSTAELHVVGV